MSDAIELARIHASVRAKYAKDSLRRNYSTDYLRGYFEAQFTVARTIELLLAGASVAMAIERAGIEVDMAAVGASTSSVDDELVCVLRQAWSCIEHIKERCSGSEMRDAEMTMREIELALVKAEANESKEMTSNGNR
ncbi:MAG: hypothetical protein HC834_04555 [Rhodospirillales bacterium]|nr:hypothetical protein [Rhodospirillales bacterium]